jgi:hypothetical protein
MNASEQFDLVTTVQESSCTSILSVLPDSEPAFFAAHVHSALVFGFWCPDAAAARPRMMYSSAKGAMGATLSAAGLAVNKSCDVRDADDVADALVGGGLSQQAAAGATDDSAAIQELQFDKPSAPGTPGAARRRKGRGKPKLAASAL